MLLPDLSEFLSLQDHFVLIVEMVLLTHQHLHDFPQLLKLKWLLQSLLQQLIFLISFPFLSPNPPNFYIDIYSYHFA